MTTWQAAVSSALYAVLVCANAFCVEPSTTTSKPQQSEATSEQLLIAMHAVCSRVDAVAFMLEHGCFNLTVLSNVAVPDAPRASDVTLPVTAGKQPLHITVPGSSAPRIRSVSAEAHVTVNRVDACHVW